MMLGLRARAKSMVGNRCMGRRSCQCGLQEQGMLRDDLSAAVFIEPHCVLYA